MRSEYELEEKSLLTDVHEMEMRGSRSSGPCGDEPRPQGRQDPRKRQGPALNARQP